MKSLRLSALALAGLCTAASAHAQSVEFRIVEREGQGAIGTAADAQLNMAVQARVVGAAGAALAGFSFDVAVRGEPDAFGVFERGRISNVDGTYSSIIDVSSAVGLGGLARQYTFIANVSSSFNGLINTSGGTFTNSPEQEIGLVVGSAAGAALLGIPGLDVNQDGNPDTWPGTGMTASIDPTAGATYLGLNGAWIDVYRFRYTATELSSRTLHFELRNAEAQAFTTFTLSSNNTWGPAGMTVAASSTPLDIPIAVSESGACCDASGACTTTTGAGCAGSLAVGAACGATPCPVFGTCCSVLAACQVSPQAACTGTWTQGGACTPNPCPAIGACCTQTDTCTLLFQADCHGFNWVAGGTCTPNACAAPGACCGVDCQFLSPRQCTMGRTWMLGVCTPNPCPPPTACCNPTSGACSLVVAAGDITSTYSYVPGAPGYARSDAGGVINSVTATFRPLTGRLTFEASFSAPVSGDPPTTSGFWLVLDNGPDPKHHPGELAILYFDASSLASPKLTVYAFNGADANTSWSDGDPATGGDQIGDLIKGVYETSYITSISAIDITLSGGQIRRFMSFDIDASDIVSHVPLYPAASPWYGIGFDRGLGVWLHPVGVFGAAYEPPGSGIRGRLTSLATSSEGWLDGANRTAVSTDPCPFPARLATAAACSPMNTCPQRRACCNPATGMCVTVAPADDCPTNYAFASPGTATCAPNPCPSPLLQPTGACCNALTGMCGVLPLSACGPSTHTWIAGGACSPNPCPPRQGACCNVVTGVCAVSAQAACAPAAHDWVPGATCASAACAAPGICCNTSTGTCRRLTQSRCGASGTWSPSGACTPSPCALAGRCCNVFTGACQIATQSACGSAAHEWMPGASCTPNPCSAPGVCCNLTTGQCRRIAQARCTSGSVWTATGTCTPNPCTAAGPCCNVVTGACQLTTRQQCAPAAHEWMPGSACTPSPCEAVGACCNLGAGQCRRLTRDRCIENSVWVAGATCTPTPCMLPYGACCNVVTGSCAVGMQSDCAPAAHDWFAGGVCTPNTCAAPAACCNIAAGTCRRLTEIRCSGVGGEWHADQTCSASPCASAVVAPCAADFNRSGHADVQDVLAFVAAWFAADANADPGADLDTDGEIEPADLFAFLTVWFAGC